MQALVRQGMDAGAVGLSTGLDYIPSRYADAREIAALCAAIAPDDGVYVTHMRGYGPKAPEGMAEVYEIARSSGVAAHVSHYNGPADLLAPPDRPGAGAGPRPDLRHLSLPRRQHDPGHGRAPAVGPGRGDRADARAAGRSGHPRPAERRVVLDAHALPARHDHDRDGGRPRLALGRGDDGHRGRRAAPAWRPGDFVCEILLGLGHGRRDRRLPRRRPDRGRRPRHPPPPRAHGRLRRHLLRRLPPPPRLGRLRPLPRLPHPRSSAITPGPRPSPTSPPTPRAGSA